MMDKSISIKERIMVLLSGRGSNFINLAKYLKTNSHHKIIAVASDNPAAQGLSYAKEIALPILLLDYQAGRGFAEKTLADYIIKENIYYILLAGFMKILSKDFVMKFPHRILNIHPSLLPLYKGLDTHKRVIANGDKEHGCSVHLVDETLDGGALLAQRWIKVLPNDTEESLAEKVLAMEHELYPFVLQHIEILIEPIL
ncbi:MAG: phosphoribosylglycinamide formyltransferase [Alphaproteobacteria bacterium]